MNFFKNSVLMSFSLMGEKWCVTERHCKGQNSGSTKRERKLKDKNSSGSGLSWGHGERVSTCMKILCISQVQTSAEGFVTNISGLFKRPWSAGTRT